MLPSDFHELMTSPEIFTVNLSLVDRPFEGQTSRKHYRSNIEMHSLFNSIVTHLFHVWATTGHGELSINSEVYQNKIRVFIQGCPTYRFYIGKDQLAEIRDVYDQICHEAMQRVVQK